MLDIFGDSLMSKYLKLKNDKMKTIICGECKNEYTLNDIKFEETVMESHKQNMWFKVLFFRCPKCKHSEIVTIDTKETLFVKEELEKIEKYLHNNKKFKNKKQVKRYDHLRNKISFLYSQNKEVLGKTLSQILDEQ